MSMYKMYGRGSAPESNGMQKNPNRVIGGLKGQGADSFAVTGFDGKERQVATQAYVQGIEEQLRRLAATVREQEKRIRRANGSNSTIPTERKNGL